MKIIDLLDKNLLKFLLLLFNIDQYSSPNEHVEYSFNTDLWDYMIGNCIAPARYNANLTSSTSFLNRMLSLSLFPVIFKSGTSKSINGLTDFYNRNCPIPPSPSLNQLCLGHMANKILIRGVGIIKYLFQERSDTFVVKHTMLLYPKCQGLSPESATSI